MRREAAPHVCVVQQERRGTAHAALMAAPHFGDGEVAVLYADNPLIRPETLRRLLERRAAGDAALALLAFRPADPARYGRVIARDGYVERIVEWIDAAADGTRRDAVQRRRAVRRRRRHDALAGRGARRQCQGRILPHRRGRPGARRRRARRRGGGAGRRTGRHQLARRTRGGRGGGAVLAARRRDGCRRHHDRSRLGVPVRRHRTRARRDDRAQRGVRPGREGRDRRADPCVQSPGRLHRRARLHRRPASPGCAPARSSASRCMSATSSR